jgi:fatty-acid desaturase
MNTTNDLHRIEENTSTSSEIGFVKWSPVKSSWYSTHALIAIVGGTTYFSWSAFTLFVAFTLLTLCLGHSLGMHRRLIHNSYDCPKWLEYLFVHFGVLVGMAGPYGMIYQHDLRDWAQRKNNCHTYLRHGENIVKDGWWQLHCDLILSNPPKFVLENNIDTKVYRILESTWMLQQLPWAILFYAIGDISWVIWGISARVFISVTGHWLVGYFAHNHGERDWHIEGAAVQGHNLPWVAVLSMGESWHNNHHAYPRSARLGIDNNQPDPGWLVLCHLEKWGMVWNIILPSDLPERKELTPINHLVKHKIYNYYEQKVFQ